MTQKKSENLSNNKKWRKLGVLENLSNAENGASVPKTCDTLQRQFHSFQGAVAEAFKNHVLKIVPEELVCSNDRAMDSAQ